MTGVGDQAINTDETAAIVACPSCGGSDWVALQMSFDCQAVHGELRVQLFLGGGLWPDKWGCHDDAGMTETYAWDCIACDALYADADLLRWAMQIDDTPPEPTSYVQAEIAWLLQRLNRIGAKA